MSSSVNNKHFFHLNALPRSPSLTWHEHLEIVIYDFYGAITSSEKLHHLLNPAGGTPAETRNLWFELRNQTLISQGDLSKNVVAKIKKKKYLGKLAIKYKTEDFKLQLTMDPQNLAG